MDAYNPDLSRISKLLIDREQVSPEVAQGRRQNFSITLHCGADVRGSYTLQLAILTAANIAHRCFPGSTRIVLDPALQDAPSLVWPALNWTFGQALQRILGAGTFSHSITVSSDGHMIVFGNAAASKGALRVTFDGWIAQVGPAASMPRLQEREYCTLAGIAAGSLALSELFLAFAGINREASRRVIALSLWRPDLPADDPAALGVPVEYLPRALWVLGLGHLGNGYLWALATLPYQQPDEAVFSLFDFDKVEDANVETGIIFTPASIGETKARACSHWLEQRGIHTRLVERRYDSTFRCQDKEPLLALCGFDSNAARRDLITAGFRRVIECGLGGTINNFDTVSLHTLPNPRSVEALWPVPSPEEEAAERAEHERLAKANRGYASVGKDECGRVDLAGKPIAVPFVGAFAGTLVVAEVLRIAHGGAAYTDLKVRLGAPGNRVIQVAKTYTADDLVGVEFSEAKKLL